MEKCIYVIGQSPGATQNWWDICENQLVPTLRKMGGRHLTLLLPDQRDLIHKANPGRLLGPVEKIEAVIELWLPSVDDETRLRESLNSTQCEIWAYLVTESTIAPCPYRVNDGERVPGVTQWGINAKPPEVTMADFYREWAVHSKMSFDLHPTRASYVRNAVARALTPESPDYQGIVSERFPELNHFTDDAIYFGDEAVVQAMFEHLPSFFEFSTALSGGFSEYRWA